jgi:hypothetical protein
MMASLNEKIAKLIPMLSSDKDGEVVAIERVLKSDGCDLHDLASGLVNGEAVMPSGGRQYSFDEIRRCPTRNGNASSSIRSLCSHIARIHTKREAGENSGAASREVRATQQ